MQAYRLRIADGHHTQVVKVCVEPRSNCAAFVLADSSCLLVSLSSLPAIQPTPIPAPCTDACFLRLQARVLAGGGSLLPSRAYPVDRGASGGISTSGGESREHYVKVGETSGGEAGKSTPRVGLRGRVGSKFPANANGKGVAGNIRTRVYFLTSQPAKGGSCIDLFAWHCEPPSFTRANVEIDRARRSSKGSESRNPDHDLQGRLARKWRAARLEIPHGMVMKMVASVNVVIVYSIAAGKIWVLAAKHVGLPELPKDHGGRSFRGSGLSPVEKDLDIGLSSRRAESGRDGESPGHLLLMKCAVLECNRPIYSLYVSPQHLLLGEAGGIWIWPLRPLIKPDKRLKERERPKDPTIRSEDSRLLVPSFSKFQLDTTFKDPTHLFPEKASNPELSAPAGAAGCKSEDWKLKAAKNDHQHVEDQQLGSLATVAEISDLKLVPKNGLYSSKGQEKEQGRRVCEGIPSCGVPLKNGFHEKEKKLCLVVNTKCFGNGYISELDSRRRESSWEVNGQQQDGKGQAAENSIFGLPSALEISRQSDYQKIPSMAQNQGGADVKEDLQAVPAHRSKDDADLLGKRAITESLWKAGSVQKRNGVVLHNGNGHELLYNVEDSQSFSSESEGVGSLETNTPFEDSHLSDEKLLDYVRQQQGLGIVGPLFVTCKESQQDGFMAGKGVLQAQVVDIQEISLRRFVVLDSRGDLHLLALDDVQDRGTNSPLRFSYPKMTPLSTSIKVSSMAVILPAVQSTSMEAKRGVVRKIWISDGRYSSYVAIIPSESLEEVPSETKIVTGRTAGLPVRVSQTVFTSERVTTLAAVSAETVLVVTQGSIIAYVISGS